MREQREEFVRLAVTPGANVSELCRRFGPSRCKAYKWIARFKAEGVEGLIDRSRRPKSSPRQSSVRTETTVLAIRDESNNAWGGRKIAHVMKREGEPIVPAASTITAILRRHGRLEERAHEHPGPVQRFEHEAPNDLWQMDFKGHFAIMGGRCHPLSVIDDHSRYALGLDALGEESEASVKRHLAATFRHYGLPLRILCDNGSPWGASDQAYYTGFAVWIIRLGIGLSHGRVRHPQTQGKDERFHRSLKAEVLNGRSFASLRHCQEVFDRWRPRYNHQRPHEALDYAVPADRYRISERCFPERLEPIDYGPGALVLTVNAAACLVFEQRSFCVGRAFVGEPLGLRADKDGRFAVYYCAHHLGDIDLRLIPKGASCPLPKPKRSEPYPHNPRSSQARYPQEQKQ